jgi:hypothetical protein
MWQHGEALQLFHQIIICSMSFKKPCVETHGHNIVVLSHKIFSGEASIWLVSIAAFAQALSTLDSPSA